MAELIKTLIPFGKTNAAVTFTAATGTDYFTPDNADGRVAVIIKNGNTQGATVTFKAGDGGLSPLGDVPVTVGAGATVYVPLSRVESARVKVTTGANKGRVLVSTAVDAGGSVSNITIGIVSVE
jgi:hypothetical protein